MVFDPELCSGKITTTTNMKFLIKVSMIGAAAFFALLTSCYEVPPGYRPGAPYNPNPPYNPGPPIVGIPPVVGRPLPTIGQHYTKYSVVNVKVTRLPALKHSRYPWDARELHNPSAQYPDVFVNITSGSTLIFRSNTPLNKAYNRTFYLNRMGGARYSTGTYCIAKFYDKDGSRSELMTTASFRVERPRRGERMTTQTVSRGGAVFQIRLRWYP